MLNVTPFPLFDGNCAEAMAFYQSCLGGDLTITKVAETPMREQYLSGGTYNELREIFAKGCTPYARARSLMPVRGAAQKQDSVLAVAGVRPCEEKGPFPRVAGKRGRSLEF